MATKIDRSTDVAPVPHRENLPPLPVIDWPRVGHTPPKRLEAHYEGPGAPLPRADIVVITWTTAEWSALDHVFLNSDATRSSWQRDWEKHWHQYSYQAPETGFSTLWGYYQLVEITNASGVKRRVLLYKSGAHLAHPPWIDGLSQMMQHIIDEAKPDIVYTIGTAGGSSTTENLGDTAITNAGLIKLEKPDNTHVDYNGTTVTGEWFPSLDLVPAVEKQLLFPLSNVVTHAELGNLVEELHGTNEASGAFGFDDLVNAPLQPSNLHAPRGLDKRGVPLLSTDYYFIATADDAAQYCVLEMDDTVIGRECQARGVKFAFVRNISDPLVPSQAADGREIPSEVRDGWSGLIYKSFGLYTSFNGALLTWATIAGDTGK